MQNQSSAGLTQASGTELFALTDEQILEIAPESRDTRVGGSPETQRKPDVAEEGSPTPVATAETAGAAAAGPFAAPEEVRALGELYPGGLSQAKTAAERARMLDEIDAAYFGTAAGTPEQVSANRAQLAQRMLRDDPAAFREMVFAGLRALEEVNAVPARTVHGAQPLPPSAAVAQHAAPESSHPSANETQTAAYIAFERAANEELERSVGTAISRTIEQALPNAAKYSTSGQAGVQHAAPLQERLGAAVRQDVEAALKGDRQLGEQIAQILAARRFDDTARAHVVRLIGERAQQLVPSAARRVISEWTSTTLVAHGAKSERSVASAAKREVATASAPSPSRGGTTSREASRTIQDTGAAASRRSVDYRKLSDQQILDL
ncbi:MAG TPA: hypothetical protein VOA78_11175 [Candidatus Dormibacteraeota bacterium]|nr:hypothetical protein [Candidatus Dormibacteraeota bacterium]